MSAHCLQHSRPRGSIMVICMAVVIVLASLVLVFAQEMKIEAQAAANRAAELQSGAVVRGAVAYVNNRITSNQDPISLDTDIISEGNSIGSGYFWMIKPDGEDERKYAYGLIDESSKLNINTATYDMLMRLPNMTTELAASIVDWRDTDENINQNGGGENEYYLQLLDPYYCKNSPFETLEELQLVKGATRELLYGVDANHNGVADAEEDNDKDSGTLSGLNGNARCGIMKYLTLYSLEANTDAKGKARTDINQANNDAISGLLKKAGITDKTRLDQMLAKVRPSRPFRSIFDFYNKLEFKPEEFKKIADSITTDTRKTIAGRINVNTAPKEVLRCIPGLEDADADALITRRKSSGTDLTSLAWVIDALPADKVAALASFITTKSRRYSADIVGVSGDGRAFKRARCVFDMSGTAPKMLYYKDLSHLGWPLERGIQEQLRAGAYNSQNLPETTTEGGGF